MANILLVVPCCPSDQNLGQKKNANISVQYIQRNQGHQWTFCLNEHNFFNHFTKEMLCNNTQLELFKKQ